MERVKNVYIITAKTENKTENKTELEKYIFSHTPDNAAKQTSGKKFRFRSAFCVQKPAFSRANKYIHYDRL